MMMGGRISQPARCKSGYSIVNSKSVQVMIEPGTDGLMSARIGDASDDIQLTIAAKVRIRMPRSEALQYFDIDHDEEPVL
ncbi:MAG: hypothetical protein IJV04_03635 [Lachnospiraceae bacterium]|nr:hypothetical protein [Lachnospiraceae bacterium]